MFSIKQGLRAGLKGIENRFLLATVISLLLGEIGYLIEAFFSPSQLAWSFESVFIAYATVQAVWTFIIVYVLTIVGFAIHDGTSASSYHDWKLARVPAFSIALLFYYVGITLGFALLIVPGIIFALIYNLFAYALIDKELGIFDSFKESARLTKDNRLKLFWFNTLSLALVYGSLFIFGIIFAIWSRIIPLGLNDILLPFFGHVLAIAVMLWLVVAFINVYRQLTQIKAAGEK